MANYTTTKFTTRNKVGSSTFFNNLSANSGFMIITPNNGYVVSASKFSTSTLPDTISSVTFTDTGTAGKLGNKVVVVATFSDTFVVSKNSKISIKVNGDADVFNESSSNIDFSLTVFDDKNKNSNGTSVLTSDNYNLNINTNVGTNGKLDIIKNNFTGTIPKNKLTKVGSISVSANSGFRFLKKPIIKLSSVNSNIKIKAVDSQLDSRKNIINYTFDLLIKNSNDTAFEDIVYLFYEALTIPTATKQVRHVSFENLPLLSNNRISDLGQTVNIKVIGDPDAEFKLTVTKESDTTSVLRDKSTGVLNKFSIANSTVLTPDGVRSCINKKFSKRGGIQSCTITQKFLPPTILTTNVNGAVSNSTQIDIDSKTGVAAGDKIVSSFSDGAGKVIKIATVDGAHNRVFATEAVTLSDDASIRFDRSEKYHINIYPQGDTTLSSNIPTVKPHFTIEQTVAPILKIQATSSHATANPSDIIYVGIPNAKSSQLRNVFGARGSTVTKTNQKHFFKITYTFTASSGNWTTSGKSDLVWSSSDQSSSRWTNSTFADNGGTHIEIFNISVSGMGTNTATLTADVLVKKFGTSDVTMVFDADNCFEDGA